MSKYYNKAKITVKKVINLVVGCQKSQEAEDKKSRIIGEKYNSVLTTQRMVYMNTEIKYLILIVLCHF